MIKKDPSPTYDPYILTIIKPQYSDINTIFIYIVQLHLKAPFTARSYLQ